MRHRSRWLAGLAAAALGLIVAATAFGYAGEVSAAVTVAGPGGTLKCGVNIAVTATVVDASGKPIAGQPVTWSWLSRVMSSDVIETATSTTDANGIARTVVVLGCAPGSRQIRATADAVSGTAILNLTTGGLPGTKGGLPGTSTLLAETRDPAETSVVGVLLAVLAMVAGGVLVTRRFVFQPR